MGIANSIDLTERCLPQLAILGARPHLVTFPSYSAQQIAHLLLLRQASLPGPAFHEPALRMCARMVRSPGLIITPACGHILSTLHALCQGR